MSADASPPIPPNPDLLIEAEDLSCFGDVRQAYASEGYLTDMPWDFFPYYQRRLKKLMGAKRFAALQQLQMKRMEMYQGGQQSEAPSERETYALLCSPSEYNAFISVQIGEILATNSAAYAAVAQHLDQATASRVLELGCYTGTLSRFIKHSHPSLTVVGCDRDSAMIAAAEAITPARDVSFVTWDYQQATAPPCDAAQVLLSILGISIGEMTQEDSDAPCKEPRHHPSYTAVKKGVQPIAANWARAAETGAHLICISRSPTEVEHAALLDAMADVGWAWQSARARFVKVNGSAYVPEQAFPLDVFELVPGSLSTERPSLEVLKAIRETALATLITEW